MRVLSSDESVGGDSAIFSGLHQVGLDFGHPIYPCERGAGSYVPLADPISDLETTGEGSWVPRDVVYDRVS